MTDLDLVIAGPVATVTFTRPDQGNAVTPEQAGELRAALRRLEVDTDVRVLVLTGSGSTFNVGARRPSGASRPDSGADAVASYQAQVPVMLEVIEMLRRPSLISIAMINGGCGGAGFALALACDFRYAERAARFSTGFLSAGLSGELGAIWTAVRLVGLGRARQLFLLPDKLAAEPLAEAGLLDGVFDGAQLLATVTAVAGRLAAAPPVAVAAMKENLAAALELPLTDYMAHEGAGMIRCLSARADAAPDGARATTERNTR